jgi:creatinine amidohydrolase
LLDKLFGDRFTGWHAEHASVRETSLLLTLRKDLVGATRVDNAAPPRAGIYSFPVEASKISNRGVLGKTSSSSADIGHALFEELCAQLLAVIYERMARA